MHRALRGFQGGERFLVSEVPLYTGMRSVVLEDPEIAHGTKPMNRWHQVSHAPATLSTEHFGFPLDSFTLTSSEFPIVSSGCRDPLYRGA